MACFACALHSALRLVWGAVNPPHGAGLCIRRNSSAPAWRLAPLSAQSSRYPALALRIHETPTWAFAARWQAMMPCGFCFRWVPFSHGLSDRRVDAWKMTLMGVCRVLQVAQLFSGPPALRNGPLLFLRWLQPLPDVQNLPDPCRPWGRAFAFAGSVYRQADGSSRKAKFLP